MNYFKDLLQLLSKEREADRQSYQLLAATTTIAQRRANGLSWYPVAIRGTEIGRGDYLTVELERTTHQDVPHQFRFGQPVKFFSNHNADTDHVSGTISFAGDSRLKLSLRIDELPEWASNGKLGLDLLFDENSYEEMERALTQAVQVVEKPEEGKLARIIIGQTKPSFNEVKTVFSTGLNASQHAAIEKILAANELAIVHGPPGTGKTTTLVQAIKKISLDGKGKVLVVAPSNTAVDLLSEKLSEEGLNVLRIGNPAKVSARLMSLTLDGKMAEHGQMKE
ncbi:MAG TPA: AAA domain-containing protein, partial [Flavipsychrobacter sp.]|nr:AAA domain-containing protein [Flavipsychrobacter sp.]